MVRPGTPGRGTTCVRLVSTLVQGCTCSSNVRRVLDYNVQRIMVYSLKPGSYTVTVKSQYHDVLPWYWYSCSSSCTELQFTDYLQSLYTCSVPTTVTVVVPDLRCAQEHSFKAKLT